MTREEKAMAYDEIVQRVKELHEAGNALTKKQMEIICPQLAESEDERIINELQAFLASYGADYFGTGRWQKFDDWLEKQKEHHLRHSWKPSEGQMEKKSGVKEEPEYYQHFDPDC